MGWEQCLYRQVEVRDLTTQTTSLTNLYAPLMYWVNSKGAFEKDGSMVLIYNMTGDAPVNFEVYNIATQVWSKGILKNPLGYYPAAVISANNTIFFAGGSGANLGYSSQVWKLVY